MPKCQHGPSLCTSFARSLEGLGATVDPEPLYARLATAYREPHRRYHTLEHVAHALGWLDWSFSLAERPHEVALALWFHDVVYEPARADNEARSAHVAREELTRAGVASEVVERIAALILATRDHDAQRGDAALLVDIDLAILGASEEAFAEFERQVRDEYRAFDDRTYALGRARVLRRLASREPLFRTGFLAAELERRAQRNLAHAIASWEARAAA